MIDTLCDEIDAKNAAVACLYCDFHSQKEQTMAHILGALLKQVVGRLEQIPEEIDAAFYKAKGQIGGRCLRVPTIRKMLLSSIKLLQRTFICIDALDELRVEHRAELLEVLRDVVQESQTVRIFLTGRPYIWGEVNMYFSRSLETMSITPTQEDIKRFLRMKLNRDPHPDAMDEHLRADIMRCIPETISQMYAAVVSRGRLCVGPFADAIA